MSEPTVVLFVSFKARPGLERELQRVLLDLAEVSRRDPGCLEYLVHVDRDDPARVWLYESWLDEGSLAMHDKTGHVTAFVAELPYLTDDGFERWKTSPLTARAERKRP